MPLRSIKMQGVEEVIKRLEPESLYGEAWREAMGKSLDKLKASAKKYAPGGSSGSIDPAITSALDARPIPLYGKVPFPAVTKPGKKGPFRYAGVLQGSERYHYRSGPKKGKPTKKWFSGALGRTSSQIKKILKEAEQSIEAKFNRP